MYNLILKEEIMSIDNVTFDHPGKITLTMNDGRIFIIPLKYFPEIQKLPIAKRKKLTIVDDRTILFVHLDQVYHLEDFIGLEENWRMR
ncbi:MAG: DUF2442 domain-containing protein [Bacteroidota bacterium]